ncbi:four-helix bundle copper-binding protein [Alkalibacterium sp. m-11]
MDEKLKKVMDATYECMQACNNCFDACLKEEHLDMMRECIRLDRECADICQMVLSFSGREGSLRNDLVSLCGTICQACGKECEQHDHDHCQECAKACFACRSFVNA